MSKYQPIAEFALSYLERGFSPIPICQNSKAPGFRGVPMKAWSRYCLMAATPTEISRWALMDPQAGIGLACGFNGLVAVDVDNLKAYPAVREVFGNIQPPTKIGKKGATAFFRDGGAKLASRKFLEKSIVLPDGKIIHPTLVEILSMGNQSIIPPTIHCEIHRAYRWHHASLEDLRVEDLPIITQAQVDDVHLALAPLMEPKRETAPNVEVKQVSISDRERRRYIGFAQKALDAEASRLATQARPGRNRELFRAVCNLGKFASNGILPSKVIADRLIEACERNKLIADNTKGDVLKTIRKGFAFSANDGLPQLVERPRA